MENRDLGLESKASTKSISFISKDRSINVKRKGLPLKNKFTKPKVKVVISDIKNEVKI